MATYPILRALPSYYGSKRRLLAHIFRLIPPPKEAPRLIDCFCGGGSISVFGKSRGFEVWANDLAYRSVILGRALVENNHVTLTREDGHRIFSEPETPQCFVQERFSHVFVKKHCAFLDRALANIQSIQGVKRYLLLLLVFRFMLMARPMGNFGARRIVRQIQEGDWESMNQGFLSRAYLNRVNGHPLRMVEEIRKKINAGVFSNGKVNRVFQRDVFEFLPEAEGDVLYADPPYLSTSCYENSLQIVDAVLEGREKPMQKSIFSGKGGFAAVEHMLSLSTHIRYWIMSYGNQGGTQLEDLTKLFKKFKRHVRGKAIRLTHCPGLCSAEHRKNNLEFLVVGHD